MAKYIFLLCFIAFLGVRVDAQVNRQASTRIKDTLLKYVKAPTVERTGRNDHQNIYRFNDRFKIYRQSPWCSSVLLYAFYANNVKPPFVTPRAYSWQKYGYPIYIGALCNSSVNMQFYADKVRTGDIVIFTFSHVEFALYATKYGVYTIGGNTKGGHAKEGLYYGIFRRWGIIRSVIRAKSLTN